MMHDRISKPCRLGIVSDTHGHLDARIQQVIQDCDIALHAGDIMGAGVLACLQPRDGRTVAVRGNNDTSRIWASEEHAVLQPLSEEARLTLPGGDLVLLHGHKQWTSEGLHQRLREEFPDVRAIVYGHSHYLAVDIEHDPWVLNPGAAGKTRTHGGPSCLVLTVDHQHWHVEKIRFPEPEQAVMSLS
jgi:putative phosphoesterase